MSGRQTRRPPVRGSRQVPSDLALAAICVSDILAFGVFACVGYLLTKMDSKEEAEVAEQAQTHEVLTTHDSLAPTYTYDGEVIRWYVLVDLDFGIQYLVNDRGGCCVRLDSYGNVMGVSYE